MAYKLLFLLSNAKFMTHSKSNLISMEQEIATQVVGLGGSTDFSLWSLFLRADFVVKFVIILLIASSIFSWALIFDKFKLFKSINASTEDFEKKFLKAKSAGEF